MLSSDLISATHNTRFLYPIKCITKPYFRGCYILELMWLVDLDLDPLFFTLRINIDPFFIANYNLI